MKVGTLRFEKIDILPVGDSPISGAYMGFTGFDLTPTIACNFDNKRTD